MTKSFLIVPRRRIQSGFTLVELMVSIVIGLVLVLFVSSLYISSKGSYRLNDDNARLQEDGRYTMALIGRNLMQAGYGNVVTGTTTDFVTPDGSLGLKGCDKGFTNPISGTFTCATTAGKPGFQVSYRVDDVYDADTGAGADCNGQSVDKSTAAAGMAINRFFLYTKSGETTPSLYCSGNGNATAQPVLSNVEDMVLTYGVDTKGTFVPDQYLNATDVNALVPSASNKKNWDQVISVRVCLLLSSANNVTPQAQTYLDCSGTSRTATDRKLRTAMTSVFTLRNNAAPSLLN